MAENGVQTTEIATSALLDEVIGNRDGTTVRTALADMATQMLGAGPLATELTTLRNGLGIGRYATATWAALMTVTGAEDAVGAEVLDGDTGTHLAATATGYDGASTPNAGTYSWSAAWSRWVRIGATGLAGVQSSKIGFTDVGRVALRALNPRLGYVEIDIAAAKIRFPNLKVYLYGQVQVNIATPTGTDWTELAFPVGFNEAAIYYVDMADNTIKSSPDIRMIGNQSFVILGWASNAAFQTPHGFAVSHVAMPIGPRARIAGRGRIGMEAVSRAAEGQPVPDSRFGLDGWITASTTYVQGGEPLVLNALQFLTAGARFDATNLVKNRPQIITFNGGGTVFAGHGLSFAGRTDNLATFPGEAVVRVTRIDGFSSRGTLLEVLAGSVTWSGVAEPVHALSVVNGGQSHKRRGYLLGTPGGYARGSRTAGWLATPLDQDIFWINGATGGSALDARSLLSGDNAWWDSTLNGGTGGAGAALITWKAAVDAALAAGQPVPERIDWGQGDAEAGALQSGLITVDQLRVSIQKVFAEMRTYLIGKGAADPQVMVMLPGSRESPIRQGMAGVFWAYLLAIGNLSYAHLGAEMYDLPRPWTDAHLNELGYYTVGWRNARVMANVMHGQANNLGPTVTAAALAAGDPRSCVLTFSADAVMPLGDISETDASGPFPFGLGIIPPGFTGSQPMIPCTGGRVSGQTITLFTSTPLTGARVTRAGWDAGAREAMHVRNAELHVRSCGLPLRTFVSAPLA